MSKYPEYITPSENKSKFSHEGLVTFNATKPTLHCFHSMWAVCIEGNPERVLSQRHGKIRVEFINPHKEVIDDLIQDVFSNTLKLEAVFIELGWK